MPQRKVPPPTASPRTVANIVPHIARALLGLVEERGLSAQRLCLGLGFTEEDLGQRDVLLSYQQIRSLILRAQQQLGEPAIGLAVGARETPVSWGLTGLAMMTCETLGEAITYGLDRQWAAGALLEFHISHHGREVHVDVTPRIFDLLIEPFLVEEAFAGALAVCRWLVGQMLQPLRVDLAFASGEPLDPHVRLFRCPVRTGAGYNRMTLESHWLGARLPGYHRLSCGLLRQQLDTLLKAPEGRHELVESVASGLRAGMPERPRQRDLAHSINVSERTLRRRLGAQSAGWRALRDTALYERAQDLLKHSSMTIAEIAQAVGYADDRAFRRAFKRWSGQLPGAYRRGS